MKMTGLTNLGLQATAAEMKEVYDMRTLPMAWVLRRPLWGRLRPPLLCSLVP